MSSLVIYTPPIVNLPYILVAAFVLNILWTVMRWLYRTFFPVRVKFLLQSPRSSVQQIPPPERPVHECLVTRTPSPSMTILELESAQQLEIEEITKVHVLDDRVLDNRLIVYQDGNTGIVYAEHVRPLKTFRSPNNPKTLLRTTPYDYSSFVPTAQGHVEIPNGQLVAVMCELDGWVNVAVVIDKVKRFGYVRREYVHEASL